MSLKLQKSILWLIPGTISLGEFGYFLTFVESRYAERANAAYGENYICSSIIWMWIIEKNVPDKYDIMGVLICFIGSGIILFALRN